MKRVHVLNGNQHHELVSKYSPRRRRRCLDRWKHKRQFRRLPAKNLQRSASACKRPRVKGRFISNKPLPTVPPAGTRIPTRTPSRTASRTATPKRRKVNRRQGVVPSKRRRSTMTVCVPSPTQDTTFPREKSSGHPSAMRCPVAAEHSILGLTQMFDIRAEVQNDLHRSPPTTKYPFIPPCLPDTRIYLHPLGSNPTFQTGPQSVPARSGLEPGICSCGDTYAGVGAVQYPDYGCWPPPRIY